MEYRIIGQTVPVVEMKLRYGEMIYTQSGGMTYKNPGIEMETNTRGGILKGIARTFTGESFFMTSYRAIEDEAIIGFSSTVPGSIVSVNMSKVPEGLILQKGSFLCAENNVETQVEFTKKFSAGLFGGEGFILQKATGEGMLFIEVDGDAIQRDLQPGEILEINTGNVVAFQAGMSYEVTTVKGIGNILFSGENFFMTKITGPGRVILQSQSMSQFVHRIIPFLPKPQTPSDN